MLIKIGTQELTAKGVHGRTGTYQGAMREGLEFVFDKDAAPTVEELSAIFSNAEDITITDTESGETFVHSGYVVRGPMQLYPVADGWEVAVKQYQRTDAEARLAAMEQQLQALITARVLGADGQITSVTTALEKG